VTDRFYLGVGWGGGFRIITDREIKYKNFTNKQTKPVTNFSWTFSPLESGRRTRYSDHTTDWTVRGSNPDRENTYFSPKTSRPALGPPASYSIDTGVILRG
jgi:hypothetical protein